MEGEPRQKMGWGVAPCCGNIFHYTCLRHWLRMAIAGDSLVDSSCGPVPMALKCPTCKGQLSKCSLSVARGCWGSELATKANS